MRVDTLLMFNDHFVMWRIGLLVSLCVGCTIPNPQSCSDGLCTDQAFPFCDVGGELAGTPESCIAVSCTPMEFALCRGEQAITCNSAGNDFDLIECPLGCDQSGGCRQCTADSQCTNPSPVCDSNTSNCRECRTDDECASQVCDVDAGECVREASILYASPAGFGQQCSLVEPCSVDAAIMVAASVGITPTLRMLPGTYTTPFDVRVPTATPLDVVATDALMTGGLVVSDGATVTIRGGTVVSSRGVKCGAATAAPSALSVRGASIIATSNATVVDIVRCTVQFSSTELSLASSEIAAVLSDDAVLNADRVHIHGNNSHHIVAVGKNVTIQITNSLLEDVGLDLSTTDTGPPGSRMTFAADTFVLTSSSLSQGCEAAANRTVRYENTIIAPLGPFDSVSGTSCTFVNTLLSRQATPLPGTFVADPRFVDVGSRDFHLKSGSPAIDAAIPSVFGLDSAKDLDGTPRPKGAKPDIGAYEFTP